MNKYIVKVSLGKDQKANRFSITFDCEFNRNVAYDSLTSENNTKGKKSQVVNALKFLKIGRSKKNNSRLIIDIRDNKQSLARFPPNKVNSQIHMVINFLEVNSYLNPTYHQEYFNKINGHLIDRVTKERDTILNEGLPRKSQSSITAVNQTNTSSPDIQFLNDLLTGLNTSKKIEKNYSKFHNETFFGSRENREQNFQSNPKKLEETKTPIKRDRGSQGYSSQEESPEKKSFEEEINNQSLFDDVFNQI